MDYLGGRHELSGWRTLWIIWVEDIMNYLRVGHYGLSEWQTLWIICIMYYGSPQPKACII